MGSPERANAPKHYFFMKEKIALFKKIFKRNVPRNIFLKCSGVNRIENYLPVIQILRYPHALSERSYSIATVF